MLKFNSEVQLMLKNDVQLMLKNDVVILRCYIEFSSISGEGKTNTIRISGCKMSKWRGTLSVKAQKIDSANATKERESFQPNLTKPCRFIFEIKHLKKTQFSSHRQIITYAHSRFPAEHHSPQAHDQMADLR